MATQSSPPPSWDRRKFTQTISSHADWIAAARDEAVRCNAPNAETSSSRVAGAPDSPAALRAILGDRYELGDEIRRGGQGVVYRGVQLGTRRVVAIKVMYSAGGDPAGRVRFERETQILAQLRHPNIVTIHESGGAANSLYYVMDFIPGAPLDEYYRAHAPGPRETAALFVKICDAVNVAHLRGVIHRDLKPSNIRVDPDGEPHVLDFGLAKISSQLPVASSQGQGVSPSATGSSIWQLDSADFTETGQFLGSVPWASPEQVAARPDEMDLRTDVYSLGVMLYQFLTTYFPYPVNGPVRAVLENICNFDPKNPAEVSPSVGDDLAQIVLKCLRKRPDDRYQTAGDVARELRRYLAGEPIEAKRDQTWYMLRKRLRRYRAAAMVASLLVLLGVGSLAALATYYREEHRLRTAAENSQRDAEAARAEATEARNAAQRALKEEEAQRALAEKRAKQTRAVAKFQAALLESIDAEAMGREIKELFREHVRKAIQRRTADDAAESPSDSGPELAAYDALTASVSPVDVVRRALARHVLAKVPETVDTQFAGQPRVQAELLLTLGATLRNLGLFAEAVPQLRRALELVRDPAITDSDQQRLTDETDVLSHLAGTLSRMARFAEAEDVHRQAYDAINRANPEGCPDAIRALGNVAAMRAARGDSDRATQMFRQAVEQARQLPAPERLFLAEALGNLGTVLAQRGEFDEAEEYLVEALELREAELGPSDGSVAVDLTNLGNVYSVMGRPEQAEKLLRRALELQRARRGDEHVDTADAMSSLAMFLRERDPAAARQLHENALAIYRGAHNENHPKTAMALDNLGQFLRQIGDYAAAEPLVREALALRRELLPPDHPDIVQSLSNLARVRLSRNAPAEAAELYREGIEISERTGAPARQERMIAMRVGLGRSLTALGELDRAAHELDLAQAVITDNPGVSARVRRGFYEGKIELYRAMHATQPDAGHAATADKWEMELLAWKASTQPTTR